MPKPYATQKVPGHLAIIMDGNGRWAQNRSRPRAYGHHAGRDSAERCIEFCAASGVRTLTLFAFSTENWRRPEKEITLLMTLIRRTVQSYTPKLKKNGIRLHFIGDRLKLSSALQKEMRTAEEETAGGQRMDLILALNYSGHWSILEAARKAAADGISLETEENFHACFPDPKLPPVDLLIRTSGEMRISNFLLWELAYAELYFTETLWPDFDKEDLEAAFAAYASRERRFGALPEKHNHA